MKILIIQLKRLGDVLLSTPLANSLKATYPEAEIDFITSTAESEVVIGNPNIRKVWKVSNRDRRYGVGYMKLLFQLFFQRYDMVFNVNGKFEGMLITIASAAPIRVGWDKKGWRFINTVSVRPEEYRQLSGMAQTIDDRLALVRSVVPELKIDSEIYLWLKREEVETMRFKMKASGIDFSKPIMAIGVTSRRWYRVWEMEKFIEISRYFIEQYDMQIIPFYASEEYEVICEYQKKIASTQVFDIRTESVRELAAMLSLCSLYFGNETGPRHIAQAVGTPSYTIFRDNIATEWFLPSGHPRHRVVTYQEAYGLSQSEFELLFSLSKEELFSNYEISVDFVIDDFKTWATREHVLVGE